MPSFSFTVPGRVPGLNNLGLSGGGWRKSGRIKKHWTQLVATCAGQADGLKLALPSPARIDLHIVEPRKHKRDPDNIASVARKNVHDGLQLAGVLLGDGWDHVVPDLRTTLELGEPARIEVTVTWGDQ